VNQLRKAVRPRHQQVEEHEIGGGVRGDRVLELW